MVGCVCLVTKARNTRVLIEGWMYQSGGVIKQKGELKAPRLELLLVDYLSEKELLKNEDENNPSLGKQ